MISLGSGKRQASEPASSTEDLALNETSSSRLEPPEVFVSQSEVSKRISGTNLMSDRPLKRRRLQKVAEYVKQNLSKFKTESTTIQDEAAELVASDKSSSKGGALREEQSVNQAELSDATAESQLSQASLAPEETGSVIDAAERQAERFMKENDPQAESVASPSSPTKKRRKADSVLKAVAENSTKVGDPKVQDLKRTESSKTVVELDSSTEKSNNRPTDVADVEDVKVCDICGDAGFEEMLAVCTQCNEGAEHIYCMQTLLEELPEGEWLCEGCKLKREANGKLPDKPEPSLKRRSNSFKNEGPSRMESKILQKRKSDLLAPKPEDESQRPPEPSRLPLSSGKGPDAGKVKPLTVGSKLVPTAASKAFPKGKSPTTTKGPYHFLLNAKPGAAQKSAATLTEGSKLVKAKEEVEAGKKDDTPVLKKGDPPLDNKQRNSPSSANTGSNGAAENLPSAGWSSDKVSKTIRCYKCKEIGHSAQACTSGAALPSKSTTVLRQDEAKKGKTVNPQQVPAEVSDRPVMVAAVEKNDRPVISREQSLEKPDRPTTAKEQIPTTVREQVPTDRPAIQLPTGPATVKEQIQTDRPTIQIPTAPATVREQSSTIQLPTGPATVIPTDRPALQFPTGPGTGREQISMDRPTIQLPTGPATVIPTDRPALQFSTGPGTGREQILTDRPAIQFPTAASIMEKTNMNAKGILGQIMQQSAEKPSHLERAPAGPPVGEKPSPLGPPTVSPLEHAPQRPPTAQPLPPPYDVRLPPAAGPRPESPAVPINQFLWRGRFEISSNGNVALYDGIQAHPSDRAAPKVLEVSRSLPTPLKLNEVERVNSWPKRFLASPPNDGDIALYFFPKDDGSFAKQYYELVERMVRLDLGLKTMVDGAELLIFPSMFLAEAFRLWKNKMYLWGVFQGRKAVPQNPPQVTPKVAPVAPVASMASVASVANETMEAMKKDEQESKSVVSQPGPPTVLREEIEGPPPGFGAHMQKPAPKLLKEKENETRKVEARGSSPPKALEESSTMVKDREVQAGRGTPKDEIDHGKLDTDRKMPDWDKDKRDREHGEKKERRDREYKGERDRERERERQRKDRKRERDWDDRDRDRERERDRYRDKERERERERDRKADTKYTGKSRTSRRRERSRSRSRSRSKSRSFSPPRRKRARSRSPRSRRHNTSRQPSAESLDSSEARHHQGAAAKSTLNHPASPRYHNFLLDPDVERTTDVDRTAMEQDLFPASQTSVLTDNGVGIGDVVWEIGPSTSRRRPVIDLELPPPPASEGESLSLFEDKRRPSSSQQQQTQKQKQLLGDDSTPLTLSLAVPQYRKRGNSWVKVEEAGGLGAEDVNFALTL